MTELAELFIFDFDGPLRHVSNDGIYLGWRYAMEKFGVDPDKYFTSMEEFDLWRNRDWKKNFTAVGLKDEHLQGFHDAFNEIYLKHIYLLPHAEPTLRTLRERHDIKLALWTSTNRNSLAHVLGPLELLFDVVVTCDDVTHFKPHPEGGLKILERFPNIPKHRIRFIGDTDADAKAAKALGVPFAFVAWGEMKLTEVQPHYPELYYLEHPEQIMELIQPLAR